MVKRMETWLTEQIPVIITLSKWTAPSLDLNPWTISYGSNFRRLATNGNTPTWTVWRPKLLKLLVQCQLQPFVQLSTTGPQNCRLTCNTIATILNDFFFFNWNTILRAHFSVNFIKFALIHSAQFLGQVPTEIIAIIGTIYLIQFQQKKSRLDQICMRSSLLWFLKSVFYHILVPHCQLSYIKDIIRLSLFI